MKKFGRPQNTEEDNIKVDLNDLGGGLCELI
jgi:hypothetical protein